jgi:cytochrome c
MKTKGYIRIAAATLLAGGLIASHDASAAGDVAKGEAVYKKHCVICHDTAAGKHKVGPSLHGVAGRKAGTAEGYKLYRGLRDATWTWDDKSLDAYLVDPPAFTKSKNGQTGSMVYKLGNQQDRDDVIAYLKTLK